LDNSDPNVAIRYLPNRMRFLLHLIGFFDIGE